MGSLSSWQGIETKILGELKIIKTALREISFGGEKMYGGWIEQKQAHSILSGLLWFDRILHEHIAMIEVSPRTLETVRAREMLVAARKLVMVTTIGDNVKREQKWMPY